MLWLRRNAGLMIGLCIALALGLCAGYALRGAGEEAPSATPEAEAEPVSLGGEPSILPDTRVTMRYEFKLCGHDVEITEVDGPLTGCTREDVLSRIPGARVMSLNDEGAVICREMDSYCPDHFVLYLNGDNSLCISRTDKDDPEMEDTQVLSYDVSVLSGEVILMLEEGCVFDDLEQINAFLEDVES